MEFEVKTTIFIDVDYIIKFFELDTDTPKADIMFAINDYVDGMDDCDYMFVDDDIKQRVLDEIFTRTNRQISLFDD